MWAGQALRINFSFIHLIPFALSKQNIEDISDFVNYINFQFKIGVIEIGPKKRKGGKDEIKTIFG